MCATTKYVSVNSMSQGAHARNTPEMPPRTNIERKPMAKSSGGLNHSEPPQIVASQLNIFTPVGTAMSIDDAMKNSCSGTPIPATNMWWPKTLKPRNPIATEEYAMSL